MRIVMYMRGGAAHVSSRIGCERRLRREPRRQGSGRSGLGDEIVLAFECSGFDQQPICRAGLKRVSSGPLHRRPHAFDWLAVNEDLGRHGVRIGNQVPDGVRILVRLDFAYRYDLDRLEFELAIETKEDGIDSAVRCGALAAEEASTGCTGAMSNLNMILSKPVLVKVERKAAEGDGQRDQHPVFPGHKRQGLTLTRDRIFESDGERAGIGLQRAGQWAARNQL